MTYIITGGVFCWGYGVVSAAGSTILVMRFMDGYQRRTCVKRFAGAQSGHPSYLTPFHHCSGYCSGRTVLKEDKTTEMRRMPPHVVYSGRLFSSNRHLRSFPQ